MFGKFSEQMKKSAQPAASLFEMNAKTLELMTKQQTVFFTGVMSDSVKLLSSLSGQTELRDVIAAQSVYAESVRERLSSASKTTFSELSELQGELTGLVKNSLESASEENKNAFIKAQVVPQKSLAPVTAKATKAVKTAVATEEAKPAATTVAKKKPAKKAVASPTAKAVVAKKTTGAKKATAKSVVKPALEAKNAATPKAAAPKVVKTESDVNAKPATAEKAPTKSVANLSPADVKAAGKK